MDMKTDYQPFVATAPRIETVPGGVARPKWSVMIPTYNCANFLRATLESVLSQDLGPDQMQIEVVDDCSTKDDPEAVVRELGEGRVGFHRHERNLGAVNNFNVCLQRSRGEWVHLLHGDDLVNPGFYDRISQCLTLDSERGVALCRSLVVDEKNRELAIEPGPDVLSQLEHTAAPLYPHNFIRTPSIVVCRSIYERVGGFREDLPHCADWEMWFRAISNGGCAVVDEPLVRYRHFAANDTARLMRTADNLRDRVRTLEYLKALMPSLDSEILRKSCRSTALEQSVRFWAAGDVEAGNANYKYFRELSTRAEMLRFYLARPLLRLLNAQ
jgi:glycosyltransferase involved in cell wall biosynthesis